MPHSSSTFMAICPMGTVYPIVPMTASALEPHLLEAGKSPHAAPLPRPHLGFWKYSSNIIDKHLSSSKKFCSIKKRSMFVQAACWKAGRVGGNQSSRTIRQKGEMSDVVLLQNHLEHLMISSKFRGTGSLVPSRPQTRAWHYANRSAKSSWCGMYGPRIENGFYIFTGL